MRIFLFLFLFAFLLKWLFDLLLPFGERLSMELHLLCLRQINDSKSSYAFFYEALVCGKNLPEGSLKESFIKSSILHLIVVSGSHLLFLEKIIKGLVRHRLLSELLLLLYAGVALFQAPVSRALLHLYLRHLAQSRKWFLSQTQLSLLSGTFCLFLFPHWGQSYSFLLSWCASLALACISDHQWPQKPLEQATFIYGFFLYPLSFISHPHPLAILFNALISPLVGFLLFPLALAGLVFPFLRKSMDFLLSLFLQSLDSLSASLSIVKKDMIFGEASLLPLWIYLLVAHFISHGILILRKKGAFKFLQSP